MCIGKNVTLNPMNIVQKLILPSRSLSILPVIFGSQKYERAEDREHDRAVQHVVEVRDDEVAVGDLPVERQHRDHHAGDPAEQEDQQEPDREEHRRREAHRRLSTSWRSTRRTARRSGS